MTPCLATAHVSRVSNVIKAISPLLSDQKSGLGSMRNYLYSSLSPSSWPFPHALSLAFDWNLTTSSTLCPKPPPMRCCLSSLDQSSPPSPVFSHWCHLTVHQRAYGFAVLTANPSSAVGPCPSRPCAKVCMGERSHRIPTGQNPRPSQR